MSTGDAMKLSFKTITTAILLVMAAIAAVAFDRDDDPLEFSLSTYRIYTPGDSGVAVNFSGRVGRRATVQMRAYKVADPVKFFMAQRNPHAPGYANDSSGSTDLRDSRQFRQVASWDYTIRSRDKYWQYDNIPVPVHEKGVYLVQASVRGKVAATVVVITELGMVTKQSNGEILAYVVNRTTGKAVANVPLTFARGRSNAITARTGSNGAVSTSLAGLKDRNTSDDGEEFDGWGYGNQVIALGATGSDFVIADSYYYQRYGQRSGTMVYLHTDRPVYRPSQTVYYRGIARGVAPNGAFENIDTGTAMIEITDARGTSVKKDSARISDFGTFNGELLLGDEPPLGDYTITVTVGGIPSSFTFAVEEYKKPEYEVLVKLDREQYTRGDRINATVNAKYYFGSPVAEGTVQYYVYRSRYWRPWWYRSEWAYLYEDDDRMSTYGGMQMVRSGEGKLNPDGTFQISYETDEKTDEDFVYRVQANVTDNSRRTISGAASARVTRGEFYVNARTAKYVYRPKEEVRINVETIAFDGEKPVSAPFTVKAERVWWDRKGRSDSRHETTWTGSGSTDGNGTASVSFPAAEAGYYTVYVSAKDSHGTEITTSTSMYVADGTYSYWYNDGGDVQVIPDREMYKPGETLSALVIMPQADLDVLVTAEGSTLYSYQVERLSSSSAVIRMPITAEHAPMFYLNAGALVGDNFYNTNRRIVVTPEGKLIRLVVTTDKSVYKPGEPGKVTVRAVNDHGEPIPNVDLAVGVVDEAVYAIRPDNTPEIQKFFYGSRWNQVNTNTSLNFSFYSPSRRADARDGLAAAAPASKVAAEASEMNDKKDGEFKGKTGDLADLVQPVVRTDFRDQMFWTPSVRTDARGYAVMDVAFPDNLTTWRITARGVTRATAVGQTTASVIARKDLLVRMETPRFITRGDQLVIATTVHNYLASEKRTKVTFEAEGVELASREQTVTIPANGEKRIDWAIKAPKVGQAKLTVKALTNEESDAMQLTVPILPQGVLSGVGAIADMDDQTSSRTLTLALPANSDQTTATLSVALSPSAASSILGALDDLVGYPYGCVEQTMSRFLPTVLVADVLKKLDVPFDKTKREELPKMVNKGLTRLYALQHDDGGWGWWEHDQTNPFMTAYVMYGLTVARGAGYRIDEDRYQNGLRSLRSMIESRKAGGGLGDGDKRLEGTTEAYMLYVATLVGRGRNEDLYRERITALLKRDDLNNYAVALLAMASRNQNDRATADRLAQRLVSAAEVSTTAAHWSGKSWHYNWQDDAVETSAAAIKALLEIQGETELVKKGIHYLLGQKQGDSWGNTRQTAMVVYALADYIAASHELEPDYTATVRVNGREVFSKRFTKADVFSPEQQIKLDNSVLRQGANTVTIEKSGRGKLYATARLTYFATGPALAASDAGFKVSREYFTLKREWKKDRYVYSKTPFNGTAKSGDEIFVKVRITPGSRYEYFMLEDPLPAGCEVVTKTEGYTIPGESDYGGDDANYPYYRYRWNWWYADRDVRDEKVAFFARTIEAQTYEFSYIMRAQIPGEYSVMPSVGALMYYPEVRGNSNSIALKITS